MQILGPSEELFEGCKEDRWTRKTVCVCVCVCVCVFCLRERERERTTYRQTDRQCYNRISQDTKTKHKNIQKEANKQANR